MSGLTDGEAGELEHRRSLPFSTRVAQGWSKRAVLLVVSLLPARAIAQNPAAMTVSPEKATMLIGETHRFRVVGRDGGMRHNVRWSISPEHAATLILSGDEVIVQARQVSSGVLLTAYAEGDSAEATIEIVAGNALPTGTVKWSVPEIPGCTNKKMIQAVPSANGPDLYVQEECPQGTLIRAITDDGRELWRRFIGGPGAVLPAELGARQGTKTEHLNMQAKSVCDAVSPGMPRDQVAKVLTARNLNLEERQRQSDTWTLEEEGSHCTISFDGKTGAVVKKEKAIVTD